jgi:hypothetical protein
VEFQLALVVLCTHMGRVIKFCGYLASSQKSFLKTPDFFQQLFNVAVSSWGLQEDAVAQQVLKEVPQELLLDVVNNEHLTVQR